MNEQYDLNPDFTIGGNPIYSSLNHNSKGDQHTQYFNSLKTRRTGLSSSTNKVYNVGTITISKNGTYGMLSLEYFRFDSNNSILEPYGKLFVKSGMIEATSTNFVKMSMDKLNDYGEFYSKIVSSSITEFVVDIYFVIKDSTYTETRYQFVPYLMLSSNSLYTKFDFYVDQAWLTELPSGTVLCDYSDKDTVTAITLLNSWTNPATVTSKVVKNGKKVKVNVMAKPGVLTNFTKLCDMPYEAKYAYEFAGLARMTDGTCAPVGLLFTTVGGVTGAQIFGISGAMTTISVVSFDFEYETV